MLAHSTQPVQSVFYPNSYPLINQAIENGSASWIGPVYPKFAAG
jgi:hypothetical protein